jgi:hypothetical protein
LLLFTFSSKKGYKKMALDNTKSTTSTDPNKGSAPVVPPKQTGEINGKPVEVADNQTSKGWYVLAVAIGTLFIAVGVFGVIGLLHAHGVVLPQWLQGLTPIIGAVGNTPHFWSLWAIASVGAVAGSGLIAFGAIKIHKARTEGAQSAPKPDGTNDSTPVGDGAKNAPPVSGDSANGTTPVPGNTGNKGQTVPSAAAPQSSTSKPPAAPPISTSKKPAAPQSSTSKPSVSGKGPKSNIPPVHRVKVADRAIDKLFEKSKAAREDELKKVSKEKQGNVAQNAEKREKEPERRKSKAEVEREAELKKYGTPVKAALKDGTLQKQLETIYGNKKK